MADYGQVGQQPEGSAPAPTMTLEQLGLEQLASSDANSLLYQQALQVSCSTAQLTRPDVLRRRHTVHWFYYRVVTLYSAAPCS